MSKNLYLQIRIWKIGQENAKKVDVHFVKVNTSTIQKCPFWKKFTSTWKCEMSSSSGIWHFFLLFMDNRQLFWYMIDFSLMMFKLMLFFLFLKWIYVHWVILFLSKWFHFVWHLLQSFWFPKRGCNIIRNVNTNCKLKKEIYINRIPIITLWKTWKALERISEEP